MKTILRQSLVDNAIGSGKAVEQSPAPEMINKVIGIPSPVNSMNTHAAGNLPVTVNEIAGKYATRNQRFSLPRNQVPPNSSR